MTANCPCPAGIYRIDAGQRDRIISHTGSLASAPLVVLDGTVSRSRETFFTEIAWAMRFPDYFGRNWDAVYDCLTDPGLFPETGVAIQFDGFDRFATAEPEQWQTALKVFADACAFWAPLDQPLYVLLYGSGKHAPGIPPLPRDCLEVRPDEE